jgi:hypothetical protein
VKLFLDDRRSAPAGWTLVRTIKPFLAALKAGGVTHVSMDHDLAGETGMDALTAMHAAHVWPSQSLRVHSGNPDGARAMKTFIQAHAPVPLHRPTASVYTAAARRLTKTLATKHY